MIRVWALLGVGGFVIFLVVGIRFGFGWLNVRYSKNAADSADLFAVACVYAVSITLAYITEVGWL